MSIPVTIIAGYLGSGKTTLVNHLLRNADGKRLAVLVNEFGELPIDADLIESRDDNVIALSGGCVCCSYGDDLTGALIDMEASESPPDHIVLEASGVAIPGSIAAALSLMEGLDHNGIVAVTDAETISERLGDRYVGQTVAMQIRDADLIILNKTDLVDEAGAGSAVRSVREFAGECELIDAEKGQVSPDLVLGNRQIREVEAMHHHAHDAHIFASRSIAFDEAVRADGFSRWLYDHKHLLVRAKGFANNAGGDLQQVQLSGERITVEDTAKDAQPGAALIGLRHEVVDLFAGTDEDILRAIKRA